VLRPDKGERQEMRGLGRRSRNGALLGALAATCVATWLASVDAAPAATLPSGFQESIAFSGLTNPTVVRFASDGRVFVAEKSGLIKVFDDLSDPTPTLFADLSTNVYNFWDRGLLGLALHPNFPTTPYVYALYTHDAAIGGVAPRWGMPGVLSDPCPTPPGPTTNGCVVSGRLSRLEASGNVMTGPEHVLIEDWCQQFPSHSIGSLAFGPDGALYASSGDGASFTFVDSGQNGNPCGDPPSQGGALRSQDRRTAGDPVTLDGSIVRVDPITGAALTDNPLALDPDPNARRIVASGLRNPFRIAFRPGTSELWAGDVGWNDWEELNLVANGADATVENFGWPCYEGSGRQGGYDGANLSICENLYGEAGAVTAPYYAYNHAAKVVTGETCPTGSSSIAGLAFYNGTTFPAGYNGALFFADYSRDCIWVMSAGANGRPNPATVATFAAGATNPVDLAVSPGGDLFYPDFDGGTIRRIRFASDPPPTSCPTGQYSAQYYANMTLTGTPATERCETAIDYDWGSGSPAPNVPVNQFSARWTGTFTFTAGTYQFTATADDGIRVWVDGTLLIDAWRDQAPTTYQATRTLTAGDHEVKVEYYENGGGAVARVSWQFNQPPPPPPSSCPTGEYSTQYYGNMTLSGTPALQRCETTIDYDWGTGGPGFGVPPDQFSARWTGTFSLTAGTYQFTATADDGIRVWVDGAPLIDAWVDQGPTTYQATRSLTAGDHVVKVEYYENGGGAVARVSWINTGGGGDTTPPDAPTGLDASVTGFTVNLSWNATSDNVGVTKYNLHRSTASGFTPSSGNRIAQPTGTSYADAGRPPGTYYYLVTAEDAAGNVGPPSNQANATVVNSPPTATIATPSATTTWKVGDAISFSGSASDPEQGTLPASALTWTLILHHCPSTCHTHTVQTWTGVAGGSFTAPDHDYPSHLELRLTATDSGGQTDTESVQLQPQTVELTFATEPTGLQLVVGSTSEATPFTRTVIVGSLNSISAPTPQSHAGKQYAFLFWSDGGAQTHNIVAPASPTTYTATYAEVPVVPGMVAAYSFDEAGGATVSDISGNGNHGTISGATRNSSGQYGAALDFDGSNDSVTVPDSSSLDLTSGMTLEAWVRPLTTSSWRTVVLKERPGDIVYALYSSNSDSGRPTGRVRVNGSTISATGTSRLTTSVWTHVATTFDGANLRLYVNGALVATRAASGTILTSGNPLRIGGSTALGRWFRGRIDEVRVYNRPLSASEIQSDRTTPLSPTAAARRLPGAASQVGPALGRSCGTLAFRCL
jgi:glucose/arabinose dehydrogenase